jgi:hypothetical protein
MESDYSKILRRNVYLSEGIEMPHLEGSQDLGLLLPTHPACLLPSLTSKALLFSLGEQHTSPPGPSRDYIPS